jgi:hypothetical protein
MEMRKKLSLDCLKMEKKPEACPKDYLNMEAKTEV